MEFCTHCFGEPLVLLSHWEQKEVGAGKIFLHVFAILLQKNPIRTAKLAG